MQEKVDNEIVEVQSVVAEAKIEMTMRDVERVKNNILAFQKLKSEIMRPQIDKVEIQGKGILRRGGYALALLAVNGNLEIKSIERVTNGDIYEVRVKSRASLPNGRFCEEIGVCDSSEFSGGIKPTHHNIEAKASTRAHNRAISNLIGGGEVSEEEMVLGDDESVVDALPQVPKATERQINYIHKLTSDEPEGLDYIAYFLELREVSGLQNLEKFDAMELIDNIKNKIYESSKEYQKWLESKK